MMATGHLPKISIITVTYQAGERLATTIKSVMSQTYRNKEYVIVDGGSTDETLAIIGRYRRMIDEVISEPDKGIYDAMNKGLSLVSPDSDYVIFMNAGDVFYNHVVLDAILPGRTGDKHLYGNIYRDGQIVSQPVQLSDFYLSTQMICHQSILFATRLHQRVLYDCRYSISADFKAVLEMRKNGDIFEKVDQAICKYEGGGVSDLQRQELFGQRLEILQQYPSLLRMYRGKTFLKRCLPFHNQLRMR
ncbi:glycosyltransferase family 2 protein [Brevibacillus centrosporus]|uniref:glycosyltransferase family 2 protein n=2 Tax=Brevibacillus centrosporus TaxID=54910 RepID=UPI000F09FF5F|nr:glycosyltransferase family 2 protein [Brevibacillus centrosporus]MEC2130732.1 glycosyltransferase family 2 protein [Brevibacillus centrosporus]MED4908176.1 glycosyltransferase family 2 protein [Brevibacillus centrosporus]RNB69354.1 glycosyltransferase [Brevibacillus centrosporus]GED32164.1 glycosyl transferase [Brevibacillus centrosporus]